MLRPMNTKEVASRSVRRAAGAGDMAAPSELLAAFLGPSCQTLRQLYGRGGQWLTYLVFAGVTLALLAWAGHLRPQDAQEGVFLACMMGAILPLVLLRPADRLAVVRHSWGPDRSAPVPGMPGDADLQGALVPQILRCLVERLALLACALPAIAGLTYVIRSEWLLFWAGLAGVMLLLAGATAWLAWQGQRRNRWWSGMIALGVALSIASNVHMLAHGQPLDARWLVAWAGWMLLAAAVFWRIQRQGAGCATKP